MRFMVFMIPKVYQRKKGRNPVPKLTPADAEMMVKMGRFNDGLKKAGAMKSVDGLQPLAAGTRLSFSSGKVRVTDGLKVKGGDVIGGYWLLEAKSKRQVVNWMMRCPAADGDVVDIRPVASMADFPADFLAALRRASARARSKRKA